MGMFDGLNQAPVFARGKWFVPGSYDLTVEEVLAKTTQNSGLCFIVGFKVEASNQAEIPPESTASWVQPFKNRQVALSAIKEFLAALMGYSAKDVAGIERDVNPIAQAALDAATSAANPFRGMKVHLEAFNRATKEGNPFTVHTWFPREDTDKDAQKAAIMRAANGAAPAQAAPAPGPASQVFMVGGKPHVLVNGQMVPVQG